MQAKLLIATGNPGKLRELCTLLTGIPFEIVSPSEVGVLSDANEDGNTYEENDDLLKYLRSRGLCNIYGQLQGSAPVAVNLAAATATLTKAQSGQKFVGAVDAVFTLPAVASMDDKGIFYVFQPGTLSSGTGLSISPNAADAIFGAGLTAVVNKDLINTGGTDAVGDEVRIECTGVPGTGAWKIVDMSGIWAKEG